MACCVQTFAIAKAEEPYAASAFFDTYSAYSSNAISGSRRPYSTQATQNNDYHINLGSLGIGYDNKTVRAKVAGQYGDSVDANYASERHAAARFIQESYVGAYVDHDITIDAGVFLSHIGAETWLSKDNLTYTRSLIADQSPYYEAGLRLSRSWGTALTTQMLLVNGWQNISDNRHPALGALITYKINDWTVALNNFLGGEDRGTRIFHDLNIGKTYKNGLSLLVSFDHGYQSSHSVNAGTWWGSSLIIKQRLNDHVALSARVETYQDPNGVIVTSVTGERFRPYGASLGLDVALGAGFSIRNELKGLWSPNAIFLDNQTPRDSELLAVSSLSFASDLKF